MFDGSSIAGWKGSLTWSYVQMQKLVSSTRSTNCSCDLWRYWTFNWSRFDPRSIARRAEEYLKSTGILHSLVQNQNSLYLTKWSRYVWRSSYINRWRSCLVYSYESGNSGHRPRVKGGYFLQLILHKICVQKCVQKSHGSRSCRSTSPRSCFLPVGVSFNTLVRKADEVQQFMFGTLHINMQKQLRLCLNRW